jgi:hypothetical protein
MNRAADNASVMEVLIERAGAYTHRTQCRNDRSSGVEH